MSRADLVIRKKKSEKIRNLQGFLFAFPPVFRFLIFGLIPLLLGLAMAFFYMKYTFSILDESVYFYGFGNFKEVLKDPIFYKSILNTIYLALSWPLSMIIALIISIFLTKKVKGKTIFRVIYFLPFVCSVVATTLMWKVLLDYNYGVVNNLTELIFKSRINWAGDPRFYVPGLIIMAAWSSTGYKIILLTASLTTVNKTYYEAAELDGANAFQKIWHITFPAISRKLSRRQQMNILMIMVTVGSVLELVSGLILPTGTLSFIVITAGYMIVNLGLYGFYLIMMISIVNTVEYNQLKTGHRNEAIITSMRPLLTKMGSAIVVGLTSLTYLMFKITEKTNAISNFEQQAELGHITDAERLEGIKGVVESVQNGQTIGLLLAMVLIPLVFGFISYILYQKFYKLDENTYKDICSQLEAKNQGEDA